MVKNISKLKSQREKIREFQGAQEGLAQLEAEAKKLKAVIDEVRVTFMCVCVCVFGGGVRHQESQDARAHRSSLGALGYGVRGVARVAT
jgi:hypothetical protein